MDMDGRIIRIGAVVIAVAALLRLVSDAALGARLRAVDQTDMLSAIVFMHTGKQADRHCEEKKQIQQLDARRVRQRRTEQTVTFWPEDAQGIQINNYTGYTPDLEALLLQPLQWDLYNSEGPTVLILHSHGTESYVRTEEYVETSSFRTLDAGHNVVSVGEQLAQLLEDAGIRVLHDTTLYDYPSYNDAYPNARQAVQKYLEEYPGIQLVLDIHRDAMEDAGGNQVGYTTQTATGEAAKLMLVVGSDAGGLQFPDWQQNLSLAVKLYLQLEDLQPEICRPVSLRTARFNQDLMGKMLLVEVGAAGNTRQEALVAARYLAQGILSLAQGSQSGP